MLVTIDSVVDWTKAYDDMLRVIFYWQGQNTMASMHIFSDSLNSALSVKCSEEPQCAFTLHSSLELINDHWLLSIVSTNLFGLPQCVAWLNNVIFFRPPRPDEMSVQVHNSVAALINTIETAHAQQTTCLEKDSVVNTRKRCLLYIMRQ